MKKLLHNDELRSKFGKNCRQRVLENYSIDKFVNNYIDIYYKALRKGAK
jgi:glycosyltransferase involved in cell wall biosynthesis